jgi:Multiubiquitin
MTEQGKSTERENHKPYHFFVDAVKYETDKTAMTGAEIKAFASVSATYQLFLEEEGDEPDKAIADSEVVHLDNHKPKHFFAVPPATFGRR